MLHRKCDDEREVSKGLTDHQLGSCQQRARPGTPLCARLVQTQQVPRTDTGAYPGASEYRPGYVLRRVLTGNIVRFGSPTIDQQRSVPRLLYPI